MTAQTQSYPVPPNSVYVWRGYKSTALTTDQFAQFLGSVFVPACVLLQPPVGLRAYVPTMVLDPGKPPAVPDQTALMFWATPESHNLATKAIAVRIYQNLHGDVYDMTRSKLPEVPVQLYPEITELVPEQPYYLVDQPADWMQGSVYHLVGARSPILNQPDFLLGASQWAASFRDSAPSLGVDGALICCNFDYLVAWVHSKEPNRDLKPTLKDLEPLTFPVVQQIPSPLALPAGLWDDWSGLDLTVDSCINLQFDRPAPAQAAPRKREGA